MKVERKESDYPYYGKSKEGNVVLFTSSNTGTLIACKTNFMTIGHVSDDWSEEAFLPIPIPIPFDESRFEPITITLETEEEAVAMWAKLNVLSHKAVDVAERLGLEPNLDVCCRIFNKYDDVFSPTK